MECPICYEPLESPGLASYRGDCGHAFHVRCLNASVHAGNTSLCPLCRRDWEPNRVIILVRKETEQFYTVSNDSNAINDTVNAAANNEKKLDSVFSMRFVLFIFDYANFFILLTKKNRPPGWYNEDVFMLCSIVLFWFLSLKSSISCIFYFKDRVTQIYRPPYVANMTLNTTAALNYFFAKTPLRFYIYVVYKLIAWVILNLWIIAGKQIQHKTSRVIYIILTLSSLLCLFNDDGFKFGSCVLIAGLIIEEQLTSKSSGYSVNMHANLLLLTTVVGTIASCFINVQDI